MKKITIYFSFLIFLMSCQEGTMKKERTTTIHEDWKTFLDDRNVEGGIVIYDLKNDEYHIHNEEWCNTGFLPASTFKIPNSLIALETKTLTTEDTIYWNGEEHWNENWRQNHVLKTAFAVSCVPCYQEIARNIGLEKMVHYTSLMNYGDLKVDSSNLDIFWLRGAATITPMEQVDFITRLYNYELPISHKTMEEVNSMMFLEMGEGYSIHAKTGWAQTDDWNNGWFVGYLKRQSSTDFVFATNIQRPRGESSDGFSEARKEIIKDAFKALNIIQ